MTLMNMSTVLDKTGRAGKSGLATAFSTMATPLAQLMQEANQEVSEWLTRYALHFSFGGCKNRRGGGRFGGRDFRKEGSYSRGGGSNYYGGGGGGGYGGGYSAPSGRYGGDTPSAWD
ncbi:hypothetical protein Bca4012_018166 [Brassica carinata]|uniref:RNA helicase n=1 Tax=Brassica carinata TaxID=52824 RepID=A0A8X8BBG2_BRACI|nr:hypothetical protein Bca52824_003454 [Brassica carinata]